MVDAVRALGQALTKSQVHRDYQDGAPKASARQYLAWRLDHRDLSRSAEGRIDRVQTPASNNPPRGAAESGPSEAPAGVSIGGTDTEPADENTTAYRADRARNERIKADRAELELQQLRGEVVSVRELEDLQFTAGRITRDRMEMVAPRFAAELHALLLSLVPEEQRAALTAALHLHAFERRLQDVVRTSLTEAEKAIEEAGRDDDDPDDSS